MKYKPFTDSVGAEEKKSVSEATKEVVVDRLDEGGRIDPPGIHSRCGGDQASVSD